MSHRRINLRKRLAVVEQRVAKRARLHNLANCTCIFDVLFAVKNEEQFAAEANVTCPVHGFRRLGKQRMVVRIVPSRLDNQSDNLERLVDEDNLERLVDEYEERLKAFRKSHPEFEDDFKEL